MSKKITKKQLLKLEKREIKRKFKEWSIAVRNRDNNRCVICGATKYVHAHHLLPRENKDFRFNIHNGISLCAKHHKFSLEISAHRNPLIFFKWLLDNRKEQLNNIIKI